MNKDNRMKRIFDNQLFKTFLATVFGFVIAGFLLLIIDVNPFKAYQVMFAGVFGNERNIAELIIKATPIIITGASVAFAFKTGLFNIGAEGQYIGGFISAGVVGILVDFPSYIQIPLLILCGILGGAIFGGFSGFLKAKFGVHEVISGIMLNWIALYLVGYVAQGSPLFIKETSGTAPINVSGQIKLFAAEKAAGDYASFQNIPVIGKVLGRSDINFGIFIAIAVAIILHFVIKKSTLGYQLRSVGLNKDAAEFAGINVNKNIIRAMAISGAVAGLAGAVNIMSLTPHKIINITMFENFGIDGLSVALIAGSNLLGVILAGFLFAIFKIGGSVLQLEFKVPSEIILVLIGIIIFFIALSNILPILLEKWEARKKTKEKK